MIRHLNNLRLYFNRSGYWDTWYWLPDSEHEMTVYMTEHRTTLMLKYQHLDLPV